MGALNREKLSVTGADVLQREDKELFTGVTQVTELQALALLLAHKVISMLLRLQALRKRTYMLQALILQVLKKRKKRI